MAKRILFVDDEADVSKVVVFRLKKAGYDVLTAVSGTQALDLIKKDVFDLMLLDLRLPGIGGLDLCKIVKSEERLKRVPVILFTASIQNLVALAKEVGAEDCLSKPYEVEQLLEKVKRLIG